MAIPIQITPSYDEKNHGWIYLVVMDDASNWVRSTAGKWTQIAFPLTIDVLQDDYARFEALNAPATIQDVDADDNMTVITAPSQQKIS